VELIAQYIEIDEPRRVDLRFLDVPPMWRAFHESTEHKISIFAGRQMGKTYNLALRAVRSMYDCVVYVRDHYMVKSMANLIADLSPESPVIRMCSNYASVILGTGRHIDIYAFSAPNIRGKRFMMKEVLIDEFDCERFEILLERVKFELDRAIHVVCVGTPSISPDTPGKRWFKESGTKYYIDMIHVPEDMEQWAHVYEYRPSALQNVIDRLPPLEYDYSF